MQNKELCVSIIESNCFLRNGLKSILSKKEYNVLADYSLPEYYLKNYQEHNLNNINDIIIYGIDKNCTVKKVEYFLQKIKICQPSAHIVFWSSLLDKEIMGMVFSNNADGFILKDISAEALVCSLNLVVAGEKVFPTSMADIISKETHKWDEDQKNNKSSSYQLSKRELDILKCLAKGAPNKTIANHLSICDSTVKVHLKAILRKLGLDNRTQAALWAVQNNVVNNNEKLYSNHPLKADSLACLVSEG
tara:strand:- start:174 stop:917 length:744 start_codon:yes stop_codon:yes gene_type:complete